VCVRACACMCVCECVCIGTSMSSEIILKDDDSNYLRLK
jgi:hypothetical protein